MIRLLLKERAQRNKEKVLSTRNEFYCSSPASAELKCCDQIWNSGLVGLVTHMQHVCLECENISGSRKRCKSVDVGFGGGAGALPPCSGKGRDVTCETTNVQRSEKPGVFPLCSSDFMFSVGTAPDWAACPHPGHPSRAQVLLRPTWTQRSLKDTLSWALFPPE